MAKIVHQTLREQVCNELRSKILTGELQPGAKIVENDLAKEFGVSRVPVREALRQIEQEGLIQYTSHVGCTVKDFTVQDIYEVYLLRGVLEALSVSMCDGKFSPETIAKLESIVKDMSEVDSVDHFEDIIKNDNAFHECIVRECHLDRIYSQWASLNNENTIVFYRGIGIKEKVIRNQEKIHHDVLNAIKKGGAKEIANVIINHYLSTARHYLEAHDIPFEEFPYKTYIKF